MSQRAALDPVLSGLTFPEAPRWHDDAFWCSDFYSHRVLRVGADRRAETIVEVPGQPSGLGWLPDGRLLVVSMLDHRLLRLEGSALDEVADLSALAGGPCNDMVVDAAGHAYVGNFGYERGSPDRTTCLARVDPDGRVVREADGLLFPNGAVITPDGGTLIVAETHAHRLSAFTVAADGSLSGHRTFAALDAACRPDGICLDAEGAVWVADPGGARLLRVVEGGQVIQTLELGDGRKPYACMLGGPQRRTLFVCTCTSSGPEVAELAQGRIECLTVDVPGAGLP